MNIKDNDNLQFTSISNSVTSLLHFLQWLRGLGDRWTNNHGDSRVSLLKIIIYMTLLAKLSDGQILESLLELKTKYNKTVFNCKCKCLRLISVDIPWVYEDLNSQVCNDQYPTGAPSQVCDKLTIVRSLDANLRMDNLIN